MTVKEMVKEIRSDVKDLSAKIDHIDRQGSIGTREEIVDHESRIRNLETSSSRLSGAWQTVTIVGATIVASAGLAISLFGFFVG